MAALSRRQLLGVLVKRDLQARYTGSLLGPVWLLGQPLVLMVTYTFIFGFVFGSRGGIVNSSLQIFFGISLFQIFSETVSRSAGILVDNRSYVKKVAFPLRAYLWVPLLSSLVTTSIAVGLFVVSYLLIAGLPPLTWLLVPFAALPLIVTSLGVGYFFAALSAPIRDIKLAAPLISTVAMFLSPVLYSAAILPEIVQSVMVINPLFGSFETMRALVFRGEIPDLTAFFVSAGVSVMVMAIGYQTFLRMQKEFADAL